MRSYFLFTFSFVLILNCKQSHSSDIARHHEDATASTEVQTTDQKNIALVEMHSFGEEEGILILHPDVNKALTEGLTEEEAAANIANYAGELNAHILWKANSSVNSKNLNLNGSFLNSLRPMIFYVKATIKKQIVALPSRIANATIRDAVAYFRKAIGRKYEEINRDLKSKVDPSNPHTTVEKYVRGFDVLPNEIEFSLRGNKIPLTIKGQPILGHMPDRALVMDLQMSLAAFRIVKRELGRDLQLHSDSELFRAISEGTVDPRNLVPGKITPESLQAEIRSMDISEYALLQPFELEHQKAQMDMIYLDNEVLINEFQRRNTGKMNVNWKVDFLHGQLPIVQNRLSRSENTTLHTPDRSTITNEAGFASLTRHLADALDAGYVAFVHCKSGQGRSATEMAAAYLELLIRKLDPKELKGMNEKDYQNLINQAIAIVENPRTGRIQAKISGQQRPVLEQYLAKRVMDRIAGKD